MELLHTPEQIKHWDEQTSLMIDLNQLVKRYGNKELVDLSMSLENKINAELVKYQYLVGTKMILQGHGIGTVGKITHFNWYSKTVRCKFYNPNGTFHGGVGIIDLIPISEEVAEH